LAQPAEDEASQSGHFGLCVRSGPRYVPGSRRLRLGGSLFDRVLIVLIVIARDLITAIPGFDPQTILPGDGCPVDPNNFGGVAGCITLTSTAPPAQIGCPSDPNNFGGVAGCITISQVLSPSAKPTLIPYL
jgi:hypothetical protein